MENDLPDLPNIVESAISLGSSLAQAAAGRLPEHFALVPAGYTVEDTERGAAAPRRNRGTTVLKDLDSFVAFVNAHTTSSTRLYGEDNPPSFTAVFNDTGHRSTQWRDHKAVYACPLSIEWRKWTTSDGKKMMQEEFARFIEDNAPDIASPPAADMIEIARTLEAKKKVNFASGIRLSSGANEFTYEEQIDGTAAKGRLQIPEVFTLGLEVLQNGPRYAVTAKLRYRIAEGGKLYLWYDLERPHKIVEDAAREARDKIAADTGLQVFNGVAP